MTKEEHLLISAVCGLYGITEQELVSKSRLEPMREARHLTALFLFKHMNRTANKVGDLLCRNHSTILVGIKRIENLMIEEGVKRKFDIIKQVVDGFPRDTKMRTKQIAHDILLENHLMD